MPERSRVSPHGQSPSDRRCLWKSPPQSLEGKLHQDRGRKRRTGARGGGPHVRRPRATPEGGSRAHMQPPAPREMLQRELHRPDMSAQRRETEAAGREGLGLNM